MIGEVRVKNEVQHRRYQQSSRSSCSEKGYRHLNEHERFVIMFMQKSRDHFARASAAEQIDPHATARFQRCGFGSENKRTPQSRFFLDTYGIDLPRQAINRHLGNARRIMNGEGLRLVTHLAHFVERRFAVQFNDRDRRFGSCALLTRRRQWPNRQRRALSRRRLIA